MRVNDLLLTLHILATATWIGAVLALQIIGSRMRSTTPDAAVDGFALDAEAVGKMLFAPASVVLLVTGVVLVERQHLGWGAPWILVASEPSPPPVPSEARSSSPRAVASVSLPVGPATTRQRCATARRDGSS